jgi:hypothetical protein
MERRRVIEIIRGIILEAPLNLGDAIHVNV